MKKFLPLLFATFAFGAHAQEYLEPSRADVDNALAPFYHGVASGDPLSDRVILWTRITSQNASETVGWQIATDTTFGTIINSGTVTTDASKDYTVKVDATGLQPNTWYYYRFSNNGVYSIQGRTRTAPVSGVTNLRFAVVACSNYQSGYFNAYRDIALKNDVDAVIHLGDYYYEYGPDDFDPGIDSSRIQEPYKEVMTLEEYRLRHSFYKLDPDLRLVHQQYPFIAVWDDHESANDSWSGGAQNHTDSVEGYWEDRKSFSRQSYFEWMPIRDIHNSVDTIHRVIPYGNLVDLIMIDTRLEGREKQSGTSGATVTDTNRTMLGITQLEWFKQQLSNSTAKWKIIGNQVMVSPLKVAGVAVNQDQWDGYPAERTKVLSHIKNNNINNVVVLTGDIHTSWANDLPLDLNSYTASTGAGSVAVEYVCTSITSGSFITFTVPVSIIQAFNPNIKYAELSKRGYLLLDITNQKVQGDWIYMSTITSKNFTANTAASWCDLDGANHLTQCSSPLTPRGTLPALAPVISSVKDMKSDMVMISCFPNPFTETVRIQYYLFKPGKVEMNVTSLDGKKVYSKTETATSSGLFDAELSLQQLAAGTYMVSITAGNKTYTQQMVKGR
ncbi:MAG: alkaline phosphatase D family protein [Chitinophagales bacterium]|nr:alkaline phosphatase D family protein [Chitinophagales bacterium]